MTLTVEDGTIVAGADSYIALTDARTYAASRGLALSVTDATAEVQLRNAFDYLESIQNYKGVAATDEQETKWPRALVYLSAAVTIDTDVIPTPLKYAQVHLAAAINGGLTLQPIADGAPFAVREKVGPIETQYSFSVSTSGVPIVRAANALLAPLLVSGSILATERA